MINKTRCLFYEVGGQFFKSLDEAQKQDLKLLIPDTWEGLTPSNGKYLLADWLIKNSSAIVDTLTTTPKSRLRARKSHGAVRKKKAATTTCAAPGQT